MISGPVNVVPKLGLVLLLSGCASQYQLSSGATEIKNRLDESSALLLIESHIVEDSTQKGLCASVTYATGVPDPAQFVELRGPLLVFRGRELQYEGTKTTELGAYKETRGVYSAEEAIFEIDLRQLNIIEAGNSEPALTYSCHGFNDGYSVTLFASGIESVVIQVNAARDEELLAALAYLSPSAKLRSRRKSNNALSN